MTAYVKYETFPENVLNKVFDLFGTTDTLKVVLCSDAPVVATDNQLSDRTQVANGGGYTTGGEDTQNDSTRSSGTVTETALDVVWTGTTGFGPFRYVDRYDDTAASDQLINYWDYGSSISVGVAETFTVDFGASVSTFA